MKLGDIATVLSAYSRAIGRAGGKVPAAKAADLAKALDAKKELAIKDFLKFLPQAMPEIPIGREGMTAGAGAVVFEDLSELVEVMGSKDLNKEIQKLKTFLQKHDQTPINALGPKLVSASPRKRKKGTTSVDRNIVEKYLGQLEASLGKETFLQIYHDLYDDVDVTKLEAVAIADRFMGPVAPSTSRAKALQRVLYRHRKLMDFSSGSSSIGERV